MNIFHIFTSAIFHLSEPSEFIVILFIATVCFKGEIQTFKQSAFGESFFSLDECDRALFPSMLYTDPRGEVECAALTAALGEKKLIDISGVKPNQMYSLPKLMYLKANYPEKYAKVRRVLLMEDYIVYKLSGVAGSNIGYVKLKFIIMIFKEMNILQIDEFEDEKYRFKLQYSTTKKNLNKSSILKKLRSQMR
mgnify:CR=1 FL=1